VLGEERDDHPMAIVHEHLDIPTSLKINTLENKFTARHRRMARGGLGLLKGSLRHTMPNPSMPCTHAKPETAVSGMARSQGRTPVAVFYPLGQPTPYASVIQVLTSQSFPMSGFKITTQACLDYVKMTSK
jgi:hypothetical protein